MSDNPSISAVRSASSPADMWHRDLTLLHKVAEKPEFHKAPSLSGWIVSRHLMSRPTEQLPSCLEDVQPVYPEGIPFLLAGQGTSGGAVGFVSMSQEYTRRSELQDELAGELLESCMSVARWVDDARILRVPMYPRALVPHGTYGRSIGLSAFIAAILSPFPEMARRALYGKSPWAATGCWYYNGQHSELRPARNESIGSKLEIARDIGYKRVLVVKGQTVPLDGKGALEIEFISTDPQKALWQLLSLLEAEDDVSPFELQEFLLSYDRHVVRNRQIASAQHQAISDFLLSFMQLSDPWVKVLAEDMLSRVLLHVGMSGEAEKHARSVDNQLRSLSQGALPRYAPNVQRNFLSGLGWPARMAIHSIDQGHWSRTVSVWEDLDNRIQELGAPERDDGRLPNYEEKLALLINLNARARRLEYVARLEDNPEGLVQAYRDRVRMKDEWEAIIDHARENHLLTHDTSMERQHNIVLDTYVAHWEMTGTWPDWPEPDWYFLAGSRPQPPSPERPRESRDPFNYLAFIRYSFAKPNAEGHSQELGHWVHSCLKTEGLALEYPLSRLLDIACMYHREDAIGREAAQVLADSTLVALERWEVLDIRYLLALRSFALMKHVMGGEPVPYLLADLNSRQESPLKAIAERALRDDPVARTIAIRLPY